MIPISVIVPIYNMENMMRKCLDSILAQTFTDYECLMIDDGSKDGSPAICDEYAAKDPRFKAFHKPNGGLSDARNYGIERAQGKYTIFIDPDDWVDSVGLDRLYQKAVEIDADMAMCDIFYNDQYGQRYSHQAPSALDHISLTKDLITDKVQGFTVNKLIKRRCYTKHGISFPLGIYGCEDQYTMCKLLKNNLKIAYIPVAFYHYMYYGYNTQSRKYDENTYKMDLRIRDMFVELFDDEDLKSLAYHHKSSSIISRAFMFGEYVFSSSDFKNQFRDYKKYVLGPLLYRAFITLSLMGYYRPARKLFSYMFNVKQMLKKLC